MAIDKETGLRACTHNPDTTKMAVFEFWDAEYLDMFILSPIDGTRTVILSGQDFEEISFQAISDMPDAKIFWFLDNEMIGTTTSGQTLQYNVRMGTHTVRIIDEMGAGTNIKFTVIK